MRRASCLCRSISLLPAAGLLVVLTGCGSPQSYSVVATVLAPASLSAGDTAQSTIGIAPANGYRGNVTLSCAITGGGTPAPRCSFSANPVAITGTGPAFVTLSVTTTSNTPSGAYTIQLSSQDAKGVTARNGPRSLAVMVRFQHIVIIFQENRTPDNLFHDPVLIANGADVASSGVNSKGETIPLRSTSLGQNYDLSHTHSAFTAMCDLNFATGICRMDGADLVPACIPGTNGCPPNPQFLYVQASDVQPYFDMAEQYTFADRMFQTNQGPSLPAHQFIISGTSEPSVNSPLFVAENPQDIAHTFNDTGCTSPSTERILVIDPSGNERSHPPIYPCFEHPTLTDELNVAGITWRYYSPTAGIIWNAPNAIEHMCGPPHSTSCTAPDWVNNVRLMTPQKPAPVLSDIATGNLQQVSWVIPTIVNSDHAGSPLITGGPSWVAAVVNAIGNSPHWSHTAILVTWDDWGGWYDHVPPPKIVNDGTNWGSGYVYGFRVPLIVISPLAKAGYISHTPHDFGSILNFIEKNFDLPSLGFADAHANDDLSDCFDLSQAPLKFKTIKAPLKADFFLHDTRPPSGPDDD